MIQIKKRKSQLTVYEKNQLLQYGFQEVDLINQGELPVEYLTGFVNFANLTLKIKPNVLIPRVETEELVSLIIDFASDNLKTIRYLEVGTGSGAISLAFFAYLLQHKKLSLKKFILTDISPTALTLAKENFSRLFKEEMSHKVKFLESDLLAKFSNKRKNQQQFNVIVANLPYIPSDQISALDCSVKNYEPCLALDGGSTGFELINQMLRQITAKNLLAKNGKIFLEVYPTHNLLFIQTYFPKIAQEFLIKEVQDQFAKQRFLILQRR
ncbi:MAG TPA: HemK/PrmC family methyltransferase [Candidatus Woesebacteria bacterium]|nr:HemK/PrmC family methyltransferase [Candidatus Woesebacteria bacterium]